MKTNYEGKKYIVRGLIGLIVLGVIVIVLASITTVGTGEVGIKTRFGQVQDTIIHEGLNLKAPFIENIVKVDCRTKKVENSSESSTKDMQTVKTTVAVNYNVNKDTANKLYQEVGLDYENIIIKPSVLESIKSAMAQYTAEELIIKRAEVSNKIQETLKSKINSRGFDVTEFNLTDIDFSEEYDKAIETKAVKQQEVVAAQADLEKQKIENEKEIAKAEKDAKVMELQNQQITESTLKLKELEIKQKMIEKWNGQYPTTMLNDNVSGLFNINQ